MIRFLDPILAFIGMPGEVLPLAILRPLSGGGATGVMNDLLITYGPDSLIGRIASTMMGSTETTFYVLAVYFGAVSIRKIRYAVVVGLLADIAGLLTAVWICRIIFG